MTAKDFRTWHGTVKAAEELAAEGPHESKTKRKKAVSSAMKEVAELLGNTPTVARVPTSTPVIDSLSRGQGRRPGAGEPREKAEEEVLELAHRRNNSPSSLRMLIVRPPRCLHLWR
jgi:DNA topoisomerase IB